MVISKEQLEILLLFIDYTKDIKWEDKYHNTNDAEELRKLFRERLYPK